MLSLLPLGSVLALGTSILCWKPEVCLALCLPEAARGQLSGTRASGYVQLQRNSSCQDTWVKVFAAHVCLLLAKCSEPELGRPECRIV